MTLNIPTYLPFGSFPLNSSKVTLTGVVASNSSVLGFNPYVDDMTLRYKPSEDLKRIYQLVNKTYTKKKIHIERTVECLDYGNIYINLSPKVAKLGDLISKINNFLT